ncbi:hypothetical protein, partial [Pseudotabrizicola sp.]|uniref:hypothetical protein n=1 Tax=Pseudotabrizicola sp. TaxID=2939647 RepID=UPI002724A530
PVVEDSNPLLVFIHVPKTSGSTVNCVLSEFELAGRNHIHECFHKPSALQADIRQPQHHLGNVGYTVKTDKIVKKIKVDMQ